MQKLNDSQNQNCSSEDNFICRWESFLDNIVKICKKKIKIKEELFPETSYLRFGHMSDNRKLYESKLRHHDTLLRQNTIFNAKSIVRRY